MKQIWILAAVPVALAGSGAFAQGNPNPTPSKQTDRVWSPGPEQRQNMAQMHEQMAACLRSEKPMEQCQEEMRKNCETAGVTACPMAGRMGQGKMRHKGFMKKEG